jgi:hypothetical protein
MKKVLYIHISLFLLLFASILNANNIVKNSSKPISSSNEITLENILDLSDKDLSNIIGHKLTIKERIGFRIMKRKMRKFSLTPLVIESQVDTFQIGSLKGCSKIVLKNGDIIEADIIQITPTEVKYKRCGKPNDPEIIVSKKDVLSIKAEDGDVIFRNTGNSRGNNSTTYGEPKLDGLAIASLATGVGGLVIGLLLSGVIGILAGIVGIVLGGISILRMKRDPDKYRGKGMAWAGMICGIVVVGLFIILIALFI